MNVSWTSQNSPGFVYFDSDTSTDFIPFDSTSTPTKACDKLTNNHSPYNRGRKQRFYNNYNSSNNSNNSFGSNNKTNPNIPFDNFSSPISSNRSWNKDRWNNSENFKNDSYGSPYNRRNNSGGSYNQRFNNSRGNHSKSFSFTEDSRQKQYDIKMYVHPSFLENPWEELERQHEEKMKQSSSSDELSS